MYIINIEMKVRFDPGKALVDGYVHCVPFIEENDGTYFLKTAFKSRLYQRRLENGELEIYR